MTVRARHGVQDAGLNQSKALPAAGASASTTAIDLGTLTTRGARLEDVEFVLSLPATPDLVDDKTILIDIETDDDVEWGSALTLIDNAISVVGAGGAGAAAAEYRFKLPTGCERYLRATATVLAAGGDNTGVSFTLEPVF